MTNSQPVQGLSRLLGPASKARSSYRRSGRDLGLLIGASRALLGIVALVAPRRVARPWIGEEADGPGSTLLARALGGRDLALGLGPLLAARRQASIRGWVEAAALADLVDVSVTLGAFPHLPRRGRWAVLAAAGSATAAGALAAALLESPTR